MFKLSWKKLTFCVAGIVALFWLGLYAFLYLPELPREQMEAEYGNEFSHYFELPGGGKGHYQEWGKPDGYPLILLHGSNASYHTWLYWAEYLMQDYRLIVPDLPAHGLTGAVPGYRYQLEDFIDFIDRLAEDAGVARFALVGNSLGGYLASRYALAEPEKVTELILLAPAGAPLPEGYQYPIAFEVMEYPWLATVLAPLNTEYIYRDALARSFADKSRVTEEMVQRFMDLNRMEGTREATRTRWQIPLNTDVSQLSDLKMPVLLLWGQQDGMLPVEMADRFYQSIPGVKMTIYLDAGHMPQEELPRQSARAIKQFIEAHREH